MRKLPAEGRRDDHKGRVDAAQAGGGGAGGSGEGLDSQSGKIAQLHNQVSSCESILAQMDGLLLSFQSDLGSISSDILTLQ